MKYLKYIGCLLVMAILSLSPASAAETQEEPGKVDVKEIVLGHLSDAYDWHITTWNGHHVSIPLLVIEGREFRLALLQFIQIGTW